MINMNPNNQLPGEKVLPAFISTYLPPTMINPPILPHSTYHSPLCHPAQKEVRNCHQSPATSVKHAHIHTNSVANFSSPSSSLDA